MAQRSLVASRLPSGTIVPPPTATHPPRLPPPRWTGPPRSLSRTVAFPHEAPPPAAPATTVGPVQPDPSSASVCPPQHPPGCCDDHLNPPPSRPSNAAQRDHSGPCRGPPPCNSDASTLTPVSTAPAPGRLPSSARRPTWSSTSERSRSRSRGGLCRPHRGRAGAGGHGWGGQAGHPRRRGKALRGHSAPVGVGRPAAERPVSRVSLRLERACAADRRNRVRCGVSHGRSLAGGCPGRRAHPPAGTSARLPCLPLLHALRSTVTGP